jgi:indolepyruvate decarboxylase
MKQTIGDFLLRRLEEAGIRHIFGVPGDFNLEFMQQLEDRSHTAWIGTCNELNASYAADGYARLNGLAAMVVTNGVGALSAANGIAGAYSEHLPVICICGSIPLASLARNRMMHHTFADGGRDNFLRVFTQITVAQAQLTPINAAFEIDRCILVAWTEKRPVYLELPSDIAYLEIAVPTEPLHLAEPQSEAEQLRVSADAIVSRLKEAKAPALLVDLDAERFGVLREIEELADKFQLPVATLTSSKGVFPEQSPRFVGLYFGAASKASVRKVVEESDCLLTIGLRRTDSTSGFFTDTIPATAIHLNAFSTDIRDDHFEGVVLGRVHTIARFFC